MPHTCARQPRSTEHERLGATAYLRRLGLVRHAGGPARSARRLLVKSSGIDRLIAVPHGVVIEMNRHGLFHLIAVQANLVVESILGICLSERTYVHN